MAKNARDMFCPLNEWTNCNDKCMLAIKDLTNNTQQCTFAVMGLMFLANTGDFNATINNVRIKEK